MVAKSSGIIRGNFNWQRTLIGFCLFFKFSECLKVVILGALRGLQDVKITHGKLLLLSLIGWGGLPRPVFFILVVWYTDLKVRAFGLGFVSGVF